MSTLSAARPTIDTPDADISARDFWAQDFETRDRVFARFRSDCPVSWHRPYESELLPAGRGHPGLLVGLAVRGHPHGEPQRASSSAPARAC